MNKKSIFAIIALIIAGGVGGFFYFTEQDDSTTNDQRLTINDQLPEGIEVEDLGNGEKLVKNVEEGVEVKVPTEWNIRPLSDKSHKMKVVYEGERQEDGTSLSDGILFDLYCYDNEDNESVLDWTEARGNKNLEKFKMNDKEVYRLVDKVAFSEDNLGQPIFLENSLVISYLFNFKTQICEASCITAGENYLAYSQQCEEGVLKSLIYK